MVELADTQDLGSCGKPCGFKSHYPHHIGVQSARLENGNRKCGCHFLICDPFQARRMNPRSLASATPTREDNDRLKYKKIFCKPTFFQPINIEYTLKNVKNCTTRACIAKRSDLTLGAGYDKVAYKIGKIGDLAIDHTETWLGREKTSVLICANLLDHT